MGYRKRSIVRRVQRVTRSKTVGNWGVHMGGAPGGKGANFRKGDLVGNYNRGKLAHTFTP